MKAIYLHSLSKFLRSPYRMLSLALFVFILHLFLWVIPSSSVLAYGFADLSLLFSTVPFVLMIFIPSLFMNFVVEDFESGKSDWLFSKPLSTIEYWVGHFLSGLTIVLIFLLLSSTSYYSIHSLSSDIGVVDHSQIISSYFGMFLLAVVFASISTFSGAVSKNQAGAFLLSVLLCYSLFAIPSLFSELAQFSGNGDYLLRYLSLNTHLEILSRGIFELRTLIYFISLSVLFSFFTVINIKKKLM